MLEDREDRADGLFGRGLVEAEFLRNCSDDVLSVHGCHLTPEPSGACCRRSRSAAAFRTRTRGAVRLLALPFHGALVYARTVGPPASRKSLAARGRQQLRECGRHGLRARDRSGCRVRLQRQCRLHPHYRARCWRGRPTGSPATPDRQAWPLSLQPGSGCCRSTCSSGHRLLLPPRSVSSAPCEKPASPPYVRPVHSPRPCSLRRCRRTGSAAISCPSAWRRPWPPVLHAASLRRRFRATRCRRSLTRAASSCDAKLNQQRVERLG